MDYPDKYYLTIARKVQLVHTLGINLETNYLNVRESKIWPVIYAGMNLLIVWK